MAEEKDTDAAERKPQTIPLPQRTKVSGVSAPDAEARRNVRPFYVNGKEVDEATFRKAVEESGQFKGGHYPASRAINL